MATDMDSDTLNATGKVEAATTSNKCMIDTLEVDLRFRFDEQSVLDKMRVKFATLVYQIFDVVEGSHMTDDDSSGKDMQQIETMTPRGCSDPDEADEENYSVDCEASPPRAYCATGVSCNLSAVDGLVKLMSLGLDHV